MQQDTLVAFSLQVRRCVASTLLLALPASLSAQSGDTAAEPGEDNTPPTWSIDAERSSHIVRDGEDRLLVGWRGGRWRIQGLYANLEPAFRDDRNQLGLAATYSTDRQHLQVVVRATDRNQGDDDQLVSLGWTLSDFAGGALSAEVTAGSADLTAEGFRVGGDDQQLYGQIEWRLPSGWHASVFAADRGTFDMTRDTDQLLERLPRSRIVGAETLADRYIDENRLQDFTGVSVGKDGQRHSWRAFFKSGEQQLRGIERAEDLTGYGGEYRLRGKATRIDAEVQINQLDIGPTSLERGRFLIDFRQRFGNWSFGLGTYAEGENETLSDLLDDYSTAGAGVSVSRRSGGGGEWGTWMMLEDDAADFQKTARLAVFLRRDELEYGLGVRAEEIGRDRFKEEEVGPFLYARRPIAGRWNLDAHIGAINSEGYGRLLLTARQ